jgi:hypothetical protein
MAGALLVLTFAASLAGLSQSPVAPQSVIGQVLALANETGESVAGLQIVFASGRQLSMGVFSASKTSQVDRILQCGECLWIRADVADGGVLRLALRNGAADAFVKAYWYAEPKAFLNALRRSTNCSIL